MRIQVVPQTTEHATAVREFNAKLDAAGAETFRLGENPPPPHAIGDGFGFHHFLALDEQGTVCGGYLLRFQPMLIRGQVHLAGQYRAPLSLGIVDKRYVAVGPMMLRHVVKTHPLIFATGMGGMSLPLPRLMKSMGWHVRETPFWFRVINAGNFLRNIGPLRTTAAKRFATNLLAATGVGPAGIHLAQKLRTTAARQSGVSVEALTDFGDWSTELWKQCAADYSLAVVRDAEFLQFNYPQTGEPYTSLILKQGNEVAGWVNLLDCQTRNASFFGEMKVSALIDGIAPQPLIPSLVHAALDAATQNQADILFTNQAHTGWTKALRGAGFWPGPSNYLLGISKELAQLLEPVEENAARIHFNRGDGDGRVNLLPPELAAQH